MLLAISDKPKVLETLWLNILNSDHFRVSFKTFLTAEKLPLYLSRFGHIEILIFLEIHLVHLVSVKKKAS